MSEQDQQFVLFISSERCQGHSRCCSLAPELVASDDYGYAQVIGDGIVPADLLSKAKLAVANCPEFAIRLNRA
ncbi:MAG: ferredoxin [Candidatus Kapabacteria bacterium]|nr:ferredoxin [Candidatus Kapabacteria bacterium]